MEVRIILYFLMQILYGLIVVPVYVVKGLGMTYGLVWSFFTAFILISILNITAEALKSRARPIMIGATAALLTEAVIARAFVAIDNMAWYFWAILVQSCILLWAGMIVMGTARFEQYRRTLFILGFYWIAQAAFSLEFCLNWPHWLAYNTWIPPVMGVVAFSAVLIGWRRDSEEERRELVSLALHRVRP